MPNSTPERRIFPGIALAACLAISCASFIRDISDIELPWKVVASSGNLRQVEFVVRPYFSVESVHLAGSFNNWALPNSDAADEKVYVMDYDARRDYWVCRVWLRAGAWEYIYMADGKFLFADIKNTVADSNGREISRMVVR
ncbi:MAG: hypothetical protein LBC99_02495 [Spirochaetota bacterium]|jgi:hypothetical protein|nr:hypothetical protein [Spirochaetota bacterium]